MATEGDNDDDADVGANAVSTATTAPASGGNHHSVDTEDPLLVHRLGGMTLVSPTHGELSSSSLNNKENFAFEVAANDLLDLERHVAVQNFQALGVYEH